MSVVVDLDLSKEVQWNTFGFSPYQWMHVDIYSIYTTSALRLRLKQLNAKNSSVFVCILVKKKITKNIK